MKNNLSIEDIKNSVEYKWRQYYAKQYIIIYLIILVIGFIIPFLTSMKYNFEYLGSSIVTYLVCMIFIGILFGSFSLFYLMKNRYLIKNYKNFYCYEVVLDTLSTSYIYKNSIYYTVTFIHKGKTKKIDTNPYFSSYWFSKFLPKDYNNKKVIGLYDDSLEKFYIIDKL